MGVPIWEWWMWASLLLWYSISLWMSSFRISSCDYVDMLRYHLYFWEYLVYPYYPCVMVFGYWSFDSIICDPSSVVHLSDCDQALACTSNRTLYWCSLSFSSSHPSLALSLSLSPLLVPLLLSLSFFECWCAHIMHVYCRGNRCGWIRALFYTLCSVLKFLL